MKMRVFASIIVAGFATATAAQAAELKLMTGPQGGVWIPLGGQLKDMWEKAVAGSVGAGAARRRHRQCARHRGRQGRCRLRQFDLDGRRAGRQCALHQEARQCLQHRDALSAILSGGDARRRRHQFGQGPEGQGRHHAAARQHRRTDHRAHAEGRRHGLQRRQDELRLVHRLGDADAGRPRRGVRARHHDPVRLGDGSRGRARHQAARHERHATTTCARSIRATRW